MDRDPLGSSVHGILQARILEWVAMASPGDLPNPGMEPASLMSPALVGGFFTTVTTWEATILIGSSYLCLTSIFVLQEQLDCFQLSAKMVDSLIDSNFPLNI